MDVIKKRRDRERSGAQRPRFGSRTLSLSLSVRESRIPFAREGARRGYIRMRGGCIVPVGIPRSRRIPARRRVKRAYTRARRDAPRDLMHGWPRQRNDRAEGGGRGERGIVGIVGNSFIVAHATDKFARGSRYCREATSASTQKWTRLHRRRSTRDVRARGG